MTKGWSPERRAAMAEMARKHQIWRKSTGPKTPEGKKIVSQNAKKHGLRGGYLRKAAEFLAEQNKIMKEIIK